MSSPGRGLVGWLRGLESSYPELARFMRFGAVGASGLIVDIATTTLAVQATHPDIAFAIGIGVAMTWNFFWNRRVTFSDSVPGPLWRQYLGFCASCSLGAAVNLGTRTLLRRLVPFFAVNILMAVPVGVVTGMTFNYLLCRRWVFRSPGPDQASEPHEPSTPPH